MSEQKSEQKVALVTGGNRGIGFEICRQLLDAGCTVILGSRVPVRGKEAVAELKNAGYTTIRHMHLDMNDPETFIVTRDEIEKDYGRLDILVNNAAISIDGKRKIDTVPVSVIRDTFEANFFNLIELTQLLLPLLRKSPAGSIVNQSSILGSLTYHSMPDSPIKDAKAFAYNASKTALNAFTVHLADLLKDTAIKVNSAHPGNVRSDMNPEGELSVEEGAKTAVELALFADDDPTGGYFYREHILPW
ncbi:SDR family NAD(P)-dependent oxidoreductase [Oxalobacter vibrioformis]|uniref:SDR family NAD(P)-dependent oxidoreductase n=1 Tax=Oxalobacter vibrioformis TaxID=933080 RepID=A0A9E9M0J3_9BURK|nr:SDR family NAD(P)-dependent oxidoreductase [Oxalobacter vibrioformis]WAW10298.1 SDR family NAD(P)-dependent oxidoreductase [Oxalobacter vibrioformis]